MYFTTRIWVCTSGLRKGARVEERYNKNSGHKYVFIQSDGTFAEVNFAEAMRKVKSYSMPCAFDHLDVFDDEED